jgi:hypothetical protein
MSSVLSKNKSQKEINNQNIQGAPKTKLPKNQLPGEEMAKDSTSLLLEWLSSRT